MTTVRQHQRIIPGGRIVEVKEHFRRKNYLDKPFTPYALPGKRAPVATVIAMPGRYTSKIRGYDIEISRAGIATSCPFSYSVKREGELVDESPVRFYGSSESALKDALEKATYDYWKRRHKWRGDYEFIPAPYIHTSIAIEPGRLESSVALLKKIGKGWVDKGNYKDSFVYHDKEFDVALLFVRKD